VSEEPVCPRCDRRKAPVGRSVPAVMAGMLCTSECPEYHAPPLPDCCWPGEATCGPGCTKEAR
jgi:hypothetical protein